MHIIVVGAGILGASTAFHLARAGAQVTIVDQAQDGRATAAGAGIICPWVSSADDAAFYRLYVEGARYYDELVPVLAELGETDLGFRRVGALVVSSDAGELAAYNELLSRRRADTPEMGATRLLSPRETGALFPPLRGDLAGLHVANGARVDGRRMAAGLLRAGQRLGARIIEGHAELIASGNRVTGVRLGNTTIAADCVIVAVGAWASSLRLPLGATLPIEPQRGQIVQTAVALAQAAGAVQAGQAATAAMHAARHDARNGLEAADAARADADAADIRAQAIRDQADAQITEIHRQADTALADAREGTRAAHADRDAALSAADQARRHASTEIGRARQAEADARAENDHVRADAARERDAAAAACTAQLHALQALADTWRARADHAEQQLDLERDLGSPEPSGLRTSSRVYPERVGCK